MSTYLNIPLTKRLAAFRRNNGKSLGGGWHDENKKWHWVPHGFSVSSDFGAPFKIGSYDCRWCENLSGHFRECGPAHEIIRLRHTAWFVDNFQDSTTKGIVLQLPSRAGKTLYLAACTDPWNKNCAIIENYLYDEKEDAARAADGLAERYAEDSREDDLKQMAERQVEELKDSVKDLRQHIRSLVEGIRKSSVSEVVCNQLRSDVRNLRQQVRKKLERIEQIKDDPYCLVP